MNPGDSFIVIGACFVGLSAYLITGMAIAEAISRKQKRDMGLVTWAVVVLAWPFGVIQLVAEAVDLRRWLRRRG